MESVDVDLDNLISLVEQRPVIWDKTRDAYKDRNETRNAWKEIFVEIRPDFEELEAAEKNSFESCHANNPPRGSPPSRSRSHVIVNVSSASKPSLCP
ncbi:hypothetical protein FQR65_LT11789 [Abscondita terminalis]|nr:hypothetical protein FQR65_LT11789 [Abscondita terminalis]